MLLFFKKWWDGESVVYENEPGSPVVFISVSTKRHWTSRIAHVAATFVKRHWQWVIATAIGLVGIVLAF